MATTPLFTPALASLGDLVPHDGLLFPEELEEPALDVAARAEHVGAARPRRRGPPPVRARLRGRAMDAWVLRGCPGRRRLPRPLHLGRRDRRRGRRRPGGLLVYGGEDVALRLRTGDTRQGGPGYIHRVRHERGPSRGDDPRIFASARLGRAVPAGRRRHRPPRGAPGPHELTEQLIAQGALDRVLERF